MNLKDFHQKMLTLDTVLDAEKLLESYLKQFQIFSFAFTYYSGHIKTGRKLRYDYVSAPLKTWHNYYLEQGYADVDRTLEKNHLTTLPLFWDVHEQLLHAKNKREKRIREESIEYGIDKGLSVPVHGPNHDFVSLTLHQRRNEKCLHDYESLQFEWLSATQIFYHQIKTILDQKTAHFVEFKLTQREEQCLVFTSKLWRVEQIAKELKITPRTVNFHLQNANRKLGTNNKYLSIYKLL